MRLLVLGGTVFLSREVARAALERGHEVTCACRGESGPVPTGARHLFWDRDGEPPVELDGAAYDAVVDVARRPSWVDRAVGAVPDAHWVFVSTINVYADDSTPDGDPDSLEVRTPRPDDVDLAEDPDAYGGMKVACEQLVLGGAASAMVVRPGLIVGPGDPTGRFGYWPARLADTAEHPEVLMPGEPDDAVQVIDVRDLATWIVESAEQRRTGTYDGTARAHTRAAFTDAVAAAARDLGLLDPTTTTYTVVGQRFLEAHDVAPWSGPRSVPLWVPMPQYAGLMTHDVSASYDAGLVTRPISQTARDTLEWLLEEPDAATTGLTRAEEADVLRAWHEQRT